MVAICRLCASLKKFETLTIIRDDDNELCTKLEKCCQLYVCFNNNLPRGVCPECIRNLNASFEFYIRVHESQQSLQKLLDIPQKLKNVICNITTDSAEEEKLLEERRFFNLFSAENTSIDEQPTIGKEISIANETCNPLTPSDCSNYVGDEHVSVGSENLEENEACLSEKPMFSENEKFFETKIFRKRKTYETVISDEQITNGSKTEGVSVTGDTHLDRFAYIEEVREDFNFEEEYDIIEVVEENQNTLKHGKRSDLDEPLRNSQYFESEVLNNSKKNDSHFSGFDPDRIDTSTWFDYPWKCVYCSQKFSDAQELTIHYENVEEKISVWVCVDCLKVFPRYYSLINHIRQRHRLHLRLLCDICNENCRSFSDLDSHRQSMHHDLLFKMLICSQCGKGFNNSNSLQIHGKCHLPDDVRLQFNCKLCEKNFRSSSSLKFHQKMHAGTKDFVCHQCGKKFIQRANLEEHLVTHFEITPYECDLCSKVFKTSERLSKHKTRHTDVKPFRCNWTGCEKTFRTKDAMNSHIRIHSGEMPFQCEFCQKPFRFRSTLLTHHNVHTGIRPYSCKDCNHQFTNWPNYNKHMKRRHGIDVSSKNPRGKKPSQPTKNIYEVKVSNDQDVYCENSLEDEYGEDEDLKIIEQEDFDAVHEQEENINHIESEKEKQK